MRLYGRSRLRVDGFLVGGPLQPIRFQGGRTARRYRRAFLAQLPLAGSSLDDVQRRFERRRRPQSHLRRTGDVPRKHAADIAAIARVRRSTEPPRDRHGLHRHCLPQVAKAGIPFASRGCPYDRPRGAAAGVSDRLRDGQLRSPGGGVNGVGEPPPPAFWGMRG